MNAPGFSTLRHASFVRPGQPLIELPLGRVDLDDAWELCRDLERLGGTKTASGYVFSSAVRRDAALEILSARYPAFRLTAVDRPSRGAQRLLMALREGALAAASVRHFQRQGLAVETAHDALRCAEWLRRWQPHALVVDHDLPWGGSAAVLRQMRRVGAATPVVVVAAGAVDDLRSLTTGWPVVARVVAPRHPAELQAAVDLVLFASRERFRDRDAQRRPASGERCAV